MKKINILGVNITDLNKKEVVKQIEKSAEGKAKSLFVVTPNPEIILEAEKDGEFLFILNQADLAIPDGVGLKFASWLTGHNLARITGADLTEEILKIAERKGLRLGIIKPPRALSENKEIQKAVNRKFPELNFLISECSSEEVDNFQDQKMFDFEPEIILSTLGAPFQEKFIFHNFKRFSKIKLGIGVGGSLDFLTGKAPRAPKTLRILGLEWTWRLAKQPRRWKRIIKATLVFPWKFLKWRFLLPFFYRDNLICLLYKKKNDNYKVLVVERREGSGKWQIPQGGKDGEDLVTAGSRELREELNCHSFIPIASFKKIHKYRFPRSYPRPSKHGGYKGQKQDLFIAEFQGKDPDIKINFWEHKNWQWVDYKDLVNVVDPNRREAMKKIIQIFKKNVINKN